MGLAAWALGRLGAGRPQPPHVAEGAAAPAVLGNEFDLGEAARAERIHRQRRGEADAGTRQNAEEGQRDDKERARLEADTAKQMAEADAKRKQDDARRERYNAEREQQAEGNRRRDAFAAIGRLPDRIDLPTAMLDGGAPTAVVIGPLAIDDLEHVLFQIAVPTEIVGGTPFRVTVQREGDTSGHTWIIRSEPDRSIEKSAKPVDLAKITVRDGQLSIQPVSKMILANPRYNLLRRSVLLVAASNPDMPEERPSVLRAIQLLVPTRQPLIDPVHLITKDDEGPRALTARVAVPPSITIPPEANASPPGLPLDGVIIDYEVTFDHGPEGQKSAEWYAFRLTSGSFADGVATSFCGLLTCPTHADVPPRPPTMVGVAVEVSLRQATIKLTPTVNGPGRKEFELAKLGPAILRTDKEYERQKELLILPLRRQVEMLCKVPAERFDSKAADWNRLLDAHRDDIGEYLERTAVGSSPQGARMRDAFSTWADECTRVLRDVQDLTRRSPDPYSAEYKADLRRLNERWKGAYVDRLRGWCDDYASRAFSLSDGVREALEPLKSPARISVKHVTSLAVADDGTEYPVELVVGQPVEEPAAERGRLGSSRSDLE
jgi:hypothetical protein